MVEIAFPEVGSEFICVHLRRAVVESFGVKHVDEDDDNLCIPWSLVKYALETELGDAVKQLDIKELVELLQHLHSYFMHEEDIRRDYVDKFEKALNEVVVQASLHDMCREDVIDTLLYYLLTLRVYSEVLERLGDVNVVPVEHSSYEIVIAGKDKLSRKNLWKVIASSISLALNYFAINPISFHDLDIKYIPSGGKLKKLEVWKDGNEMPFRAVISIKNNKIVSVLNWDLADLKFESKFSKVFGRKRVAVDVADGKIIEFT